MEPYVGKFFRTNHGVLLRCSQVGEIVALEIWERTASGVPFKTDREISVDRHSWEQWRKVQGLEVAPEPRRQVDSYSFTIKLKWPYEAPATQEELLDLSSQLEVFLDRTVRSLRGG